jgi:hypothetical protein
MSFPCHSQRPLRLCGEPAVAASLPNVGCAQHDVVVLSAAKKADKAQTVRIQNPDVHTDIDPKTGLIRSLLFKKQKVDLFAQRRQNIPPYAAGLRIYDDLDTPFTIRDLKDGKNPLILTRQKPSRYRSQRIGRSSEPIPHLGLMGCAGASYTATSVCAASI